MWGPGHVPVEPFLIRSCFHLTFFAILLPLLVRAVLEMLPLSHKSSASDFW